MRTVTRRTSVDPATLHPSRPVLSADEMTGACPPSHLGTTWAPRVGLLCRADLTRRRAVTRAGQDEEIDMPSDQPPTMVNGRMVHSHSSSSALNGACFCRF